VRYRLRAEGAGLPGTKRIADPDRRDTSRIASSDSFPKSVSHRVANPDPDRRLSLDMGVASAR
jgi:hypothetical protein